MTADADIRIARDYDDAGPQDGTRVLVDRLWPRGISRKRLNLDEWFKDIAPSDDLRTWFDHDPAKWADFRRRYRVELDKNADAVERLLKLCRKGRVTLLYGARDREHNQAVVLRDYLAERLDGAGQTT